MTDTWRVLVTGSRDWADADAIGSEVASVAVLHPEAVIVHGQCPPRRGHAVVCWEDALRLPEDQQRSLAGADWLADFAARILGLETEPHPADWQRYKRAAGPRRNAEMVDLGADACLAFIRNNSRGASGCADLAEKAGIPVMRIVA